MSKSLGNSPEPLDLIEKYGADGVRVGMLLSSPAGNDLMFEEELCKQGSGFVNKIWNAYRLVSGWKIDDESIDETHEKIADLSIRWYESKFQSVLKEIEHHFDTYRISDALMDMYKLVWDDFCSWFLEMVKPGFGATISLQPISELWSCLRITCVFYIHLSRLLRRKFGICLPIERQRKLLLFLLGQKLNR